MQSEQTQACPFCQTTASFVFADHRNRKHFSCLHCTEFQISVGAETRVANSIPQWREQLSEMARRGNEEKVLVVTLSPAGQNHDGVANPALHTEFCLRSTLPQ